MSVKGSPWGIGGGDIIIGIVIDIELMGAMWGS